jgi:DNA-binding IclR family transcriptional regulator
VDTLMGWRVVLTPAHDAVLAVLDWLSEHAEADTALVAELLRIPEAEAARLLADLEAAGSVEGATVPVQ